MMQDVTFTCPQCGKVWTEQQDEDDEWFGLATKQTLCDECGRAVLKRIVEKEGCLNDAFREE